MIDDEKKAKIADTLKASDSMKEIIRAAANNDGSVPNDWLLGYADGIEFTMALFEDRQPDYVYWMGKK